MKVIKINLIILSALFCLSVSASALTITGTPFDSSFHIGLTSGPGTGINFGLDALIPVEKFSMGAEIEQLVTNYENEANINILRYGVVVKYQAFENTTINMHVGIATLNSSKLIEYKDVASGDAYIIEADKGYGLAYVGISADFKVLGLTLTPKLLSNRVQDGGAAYEVDLNIGQKF